MSNFHKLTVAKVAQETTQAIAIYFEVPAAHQEAFKFQSGQYLTIKVEINGEEVRRAYSICTPPHAKHIGVSVKRVAGGKMSNYLNEKVKAGDSLEVMEPEGKFVLEPNATLHRDHYFFAAGSGITPILSMIEDVLENEEKSSCYLLYGNRDEDSIMFATRLNSLAEQYSGQLVIENILSQPKSESKGGVLGMFKKKVTSWQGLKGRVSHSSIKTFLDSNEPKSGNQQYYICGPGNMIETAEKALLNLNADEKAIHKEYFSSPEDEGKQSVDGAAGARLTAHLNGKTYTTIVPEGKTILDALLEDKVDAPYSCTSGACSSCMAKVEKGKAEMEVCFALDDDEVEDGYVLTCQAKPTTAEVEIKYES